MLAFIMWLGRVCLFGALLGWGGYAFSAGANPAPRILLIKDATIIDGTGRPPFRGSILVYDRRISAIFPAGTRLPDLASAFPSTGTAPTIEVRDGSHQWVIPGLVDLLTHISFRSYIDAHNPYAQESLFGDLLKRDRRERLGIYRQILEHCLRNGVTTFVDSISSLSDLTWLQPTIDNRSYPNFYSLGPILSPRHGHPSVIDDTEWKFMLPSGVTGAREEAQVRSELEKWFSTYPLAGLKVAVDGPAETPDPAPVVSESLLRTIVSVASGHGKPVFFISFTDEGIQRAAAAGAAIKLGAPIVLGNPGFRPHPETWQALRQHRVGILTLSANWGANLWRYMEDATHSSPNRGPLLFDSHSYFQFLPEDAKRNYVHYVHKYMEGDTATRHWVERSGRDFWSTVMGVLKEAAAGGEPLTLLPTADSGSFWVFHGNLWMELDNLKGILPALQAISNLTLGAARAVHLDNEVGSVEAGKLADLVVLNSDPLTDARHLQDIAYVLKAGADVKR